MIQQISYTTLQKWEKEERDFVLLDVREAEERAQRHIGGRHIPLPELMQRRAELPATTHLVCYCRKGIRSQIALQRLRSYLPDTQLFNLQGGLSAISEKAD